jgi:hypothetical protein
MYIKYCLCETTGQIKWHQLPDMTTSRSIFVIHSNFFIVFIWILLIMIVVKNIVIIVITLTSSVVNF